MSVGPKKVHTEIPAAVITAVPAAVFQFPNALALYPCAQCAQMASNVTEAGRAQFQAVRPDKD